MGHVECFNFSELLRVLSYLKIGIFCYDRLFPWYKVLEMEAWFKGIFKTFERYF